MEQNYILKNEYLVQEINKESNNLYCAYPTHFSMFVIVCSSESCSCCKLRFTMVTKDNFLKSWLSFTFKSKESFIPKVHLSNSTDHNTIGENGVAGSYNRIANHRLDVTGDIFE